MKAMLTILLSFYLLPLHSQDGREGVVVGVVEAAFRSVELQTLNNIAKLQDDILLLHTTIGVATAEIVRIEQLKVQNQSKVKGYINQMYLLVNIAKKAALLADLQQRIITLSQHDPNLLELVTTTTTEIVSESLILTSDFQIALSSSSKALLSTGDRLKLAYKIDDALDHLVNRSVDLLRLMALISSKDENLEPVTYNINNAILEAETAIQNLIK